MSGTKCTVLMTQARTVAVTFTPILPTPGVSPAGVIAGDTIAVR